MMSMTTMTTTLLLLLCPVCQHVYVSPIKYHLEIDSFSFSRCPPLSFYQRIHYPAYTSTATPSTTAAITPSVIFTAFVFFYFQSHLFMAADS